MKGERRDVMNVGGECCLRCGSLIGGKYRILQEIGHGGMSRVYLAVNETVNRKWAIKELRKDALEDGKLANQRFLREIEMLKKLQHPGLPGIMDVVEENEHFYLVMDYIKGVSLDERLAKEGGQPDAQVIQWGIELCDILGYLHTQSPSVIYRDMKPANIIEKEDGSLALIDFGTAREYKGQNEMDTVRLGTVGYAAPEQFLEGAQTDSRSDIYSLGATLYHLATGQHPGAGMENLQKCRSRRVTKEKLSPGLEQIIRKCIRKDPRRRYQSCKELMHALQKLLKKKGRRKVVCRYWHMCIVTCICAGIVSVGTIIFVRQGGAKSISEAQEGGTKMYEQELAQAETCEDYHQLIVRYPERTEAYLALVHSMISDLVLTREERERLNLLWVERPEEKSAPEEQRKGRLLQKLHEENPEGYVQVCYLVGTSILQFYEINVDRDRYMSARRWFAEAENVFPAAKSYCRIADCLDLIRQSQESRTVQVERKYEAERSLWKHVQSLQKEALELESVDDRLQVWEEIDHLISRNVPLFLEIVSAENLSQFLGEIAEKMQQEKQPEIQQTVTQIRQNIAETIQKIESAGGKE